MAVETETMPQAPITTTSETLPLKPTATTTSSVSAVSARPPTPAAYTSRPIKVLTPADYKAAAACLAESFASDPVVSYPLDVVDAAHWPAQQREALYLKTFECATYAHILSGIAIGIPSIERAEVDGANASSTSSATAPAKFDAVALWMPPGRNMDDFLTLFRSGLWRLRWSYTRQGRARFYDEFLPLLNKTKAEVMGERDRDSWYLVYLGTREEARGKGLAKKLIWYGTEIADAHDKATYLESSHRANVGFYERLGFEVRKTVSLREGVGMELDIMVREPRGVGDSK